MLASFSIPTIGQKSNSLKSEELPVPQESTKSIQAEAFSDGNGTFIGWNAETEADVLGFVVYRAGKSGSERISGEFILTTSIRSGLKSEGSESYEFFDVNGSEGTVYLIESIGLDGMPIRSDEVTAKFTDDLARVSGRSTEVLRKQAEDGNGLLKDSTLDVPKELQAEIEESQSVADINTHRWVISQPGAKIGVKNSGMHRITRAQLQAAGFDVNSNSVNWQLYNEGVEQAITIGPAGDYIEFFGRPIDTLESDIRLYYLVTGPAAGKRINSRVARPTTSTVVAPSYQQTFELKERTSYVSSVLNGELENYWGRPIVPSVQPPLTFNLSGIDFNAGKVDVTIAFKGSTQVPHTVETILNGRTLPLATGANRDAFSIRVGLPPSALVEGTNSLSMRSGVSGDVSFFDSITIEFSRRHLASQNRLPFYTQNYRAARLEGFASSNLKVYDVTDESLPTLLTNLNVIQEGSTFGTTIPPSRGRRYYAVEDSGLFAAHSISANDPALIGVPTHAANLLVIAHKGLMTEAEAWANYRRGQGFTAKVVNADEIYDEFNFGVLSANSVKAFLQYAKNNWQTAPQYVLLIGDASHDSRNYHSGGYFNMVPTKMIDTAEMETGTDEGMADFNNDGLAEIAVGRIPARTPQVVSETLAKVVQWESSLTPAPLSRGVLFAYDLLDGYDFEGMSIRLRNQLPALTPSTMISRGAPNAQAAVINGINSGKYIANYSGHGTTGAWRDPSFFAVPQVPQLTNANNRTIFTMLTCLNGYFLNAHNESFAEVLLKAQNGGAVAAWASTGKTTPDIQELMGLRFFLKIGNGSIPRLGDLIMDAKTQVPGGTDVRLSWALMGDPMLKVR